MNSVVLVVLGAVFASSSAAHVKRDVVVPAYYAAAPVYSSQYVASAPVYTSQYAASAPLVSSAYVAAPNPVLARASRVLGEPGFVSRYVAAPVVAAPASYAVPAPVATPVAAPVAAAVPAVETVAAVETIAAPAKLINPALPSRYTLVA